MRDFCSRIGIAKAQSECEYSYFEACVREYLNARAPRAMAILDPVKLTLTNYEGEEELDFDINQTDENAGTRKVKFGRHLFIERADFSLDPPPKYYRLKPGGVVRLKNAYIVRCDDVVKDNDGNVSEILCTYIPESRSGNDTSGIKAKGVVQWVNADCCSGCEVRQYESLLRDAEYAGQDFSERMNENSEQIVQARPSRPLPPRKTARLSNSCARDIIKNARKGKNSCCPRSYPSRTISTKNNGKFL